MEEKEKKQVKGAVALKYDPPKDEAPVVVASGKGVIAEKILEIASEHDIPIVEDAALLTALLSIEVGSVIPPELYQAVAKVLAFVYKIDKTYPKKVSK